MKNQTESEFITRIHFRISYYRAKFRSRMRKIKQCLNSHCGALLLLIIAVLLITIATLIIIRSYENIIRKPAGLDQVDTSAGIACLYRFYNVPVHECQA